MVAYSYALGDEAVHVFTALSPRVREKLLRRFDEMARHPQQPGDHQEAGAAGRLYEIGLNHDVLLTWWVDHATREVRIIRIELID
jgi:hypothetical protein